MHALDGYDEISLTGKTKTITNTSETLFEAQDIGLEQIDASDIYGGTTVKEAAKIFKKIINGKGTEAQNSVVCANAGLAIATVKQISHKEGIAMAEESLKGGFAKSSLEKLIELSK